LIAAAAMPVAAREPGQGSLYNPGVSIGIPTGINPPQGFLLTNSINVYDATTSPTLSGGASPSDIHVFSEAPRFFWTTPWRILGATEMMWVAQPFVRLVVKPAGGGRVAGSGLGNTLVEPLNLSWDLGHHFHASIEAGAYIPDGSYSRSIRVHIGNDFWTFQQEASLTYLTKEYAITAHFLYNTNTTRTRTHYHSGDQAFFELYGLRALGRFSVGPVAYYTKQVTADDPPGTLATPATRPEQTAVGGIAAYNLRIASFQLYVTRDVEARHGGTEGTRMWTRLSIPFSRNKAAVQERAPTQ
jgi:hypothetical protein